MDRTQQPYSDRSSVIRGIHQQLLARRVLTDEPILSVTQIRQLINTVFWASLATEEGRYAKLAVLVLEDIDISSGLIFADSLEFSASALVKLSPALFVENSYLTVSFDRGRKPPRIRGLAQRQGSGLVIRATSPGNIVVSMYGEILAYLSPVQEPWLPEIPNWVIQVSRFIDLWDPNFELAWFLRFLAEAMRHGRGGTILIVPSGATGWRESTKEGYLVGEDNLRLTWNKKRWEQKSKKTNPTFLDPLSAEATIFRRALALIGGLTAVDGATILNDKYQVIGFGRKIILKLDPPTTIAVDNMLGEPAEAELPFREIGGTRHQSAAHFAHENAESIALVTSQDGRMTLFREADYQLRALRRLEVLLPGD